MNRFVDRLRGGPTLIVSLPRNAVDLAQAARDGGADCLKVHINVHHDASGTHFGSLSDERKNLEAIRGLFDGPAGIVIGAETVAKPDDIEEIARMGFDFIDAYARYFPAGFLAHPALAKMIALDDSDSLDLISGLEASGMDVLEAAIVPHAGYGQPLTATDLARYRLVRAAAHVPIVVPTQRRILPAEAPLLREIGIEGLMIGAIVTGQDPSGLRQATAEFRAALDA
jgi:hypothetical protein